MPEIADDPITRLAFSVQQNPGVYALLLGSGVSFSSGIPTGWAITLDLVRKIALADGVAEQPDWNVWYKETYGKEPDYSHLLERLAPNPAERQPIIQHYLEPARDLDDPQDRAGLPTPAHEAIARLVKDGHIKVIITTNFDRLLETALTAEGIQPTIIASEDACQGAVPLPHSPCTILKLHGDVLDVRSLNTAAELERYKPAMDQYLDRILDEYGLIVCGWSGVWDHALRASILRTPNRRYSTWWTHRGDMAPEAIALADHRRAVRISISGADGFYAELADKIETLVQLNQPPPATVDLVVARAKRYLARPEHRIELVDLVQAELDKLRTACLADSFAGSATFDQALFRTIIQRYENVCTPIVAMMGCTGRWGDEQSEQACLDAISVLAAPPRHTASQHEIYHAVASYPAVLCFTAYGLGLTKARRWSALWRLFEHEIMMNHEHKRLVELLFLEGWQHSYLSRRPLFNRLDGLDRHICPMSSHQRALFLSWGSYFLGPAGLSDIMDQFEFNASMAYVRPCSENQLHQFTAGNVLVDVWFPVGEVGFSVRRSERLIAAMAVADSEGRRFAPPEAAWVAAFGPAYHTMARAWQPLRC